MRRVIQFPQKTILEIYTDASSVLLVINSLVYDQAMHNGENDENVDTSEDAFNNIAIYLAKHFVNACYL